MADESATDEVSQPAQRQGRRGRGTMRRSPDQPCLNCGDDTPGNYCPSCGQAKRTVAVSVGALITDVLEDQLIINRALPRTLAALILKPGLLTAEYVNGRIVRYIAPFRLYLATSVVFFLLLSFVGLRALERVQVGTTTAMPDEAREDLAAELAALERIDTTGMPPEARLEIETARAAMARLSESFDTMRIAMPELPELPRGMLQPWAQNLEVNTGNTRTDSILRAHILERYGHLPPGDALRAFLPEYAEYLPHMVFVLLPVFALLLKVLYIRRRRYYAEHFVFALHVHAFVFLMFIVMLLFRNAGVVAGLSLWILLYIWLAMKRVYAQGWFRTTVKYTLLGWTYLLLLNLGLVGTAFAVLLLE